MNRKAKLCYGDICLREEYLSFDNNYMDNIPIKYFSFKPLKLVRSGCQQLLYFKYYCVFGEEDVKQLSHLTLCFLNVILITSQVRSEYMRLNKYK